MSKKQEFINYVKMLMNEVESHSECAEVKMSDDAKLYWDAFCGATEEEKPLFTDNGKLVLKYLQDNLETPMWKARDIAEGLFISSHAVSGTMRKLVADGFVDKVGQDPVVYSLTDNGKNVTID